MSSVLVYFWLIEPVDFVTEFGKSEVDGIKREEQAQSVRPLLATKRPNCVHDEQEIGWHKISELAAAAPRWQVGKLARDPIYDNSSFAGVTRPGGSSCSR
jgi:hypothetical protein